MIYRSGLSPLYLLPILLVIVAPLTEWSVFGNIVALFGIVFVAIVLFMWYTTTYDLSCKGLHVKCGLTADDLHIALFSIDDVRIRDGFALEMVAGLSYKRIVLYSKGKVIVQISPKDREAFLWELKNLTGSC